MRVASVTFVPLQTGRASASLVLNDDSVSPSSPQTIPLTGSGTGSADLGILLNTLPAVVPAGSYLTLDALITNAGPLAACPVMFTGAAPAGTVFIRAAASAGSCRGLPVGGSGLFTCDLGTLAAGAAAQVAFVLKVTAHSGTISGGVNVRAGTDDPNLANNSSAFSTTVVGKPNPIP